jgi:hypothetical protein
MVAIIKTGHSIRNIFNYNENKVKEGAAVLIGQGNYPVDASVMSFKMKLNLLLKTLELNENTKRNSVHISLNFDPSEKDLPKEKLMEIAGDYMDNIGFGKQPYLVYQHYDAGHPHIHVVTTNIERDGRRIDLHHLGIRKSEPARKAIEIAFGLVKAEGRKQNGAYTLEPIAPGKVKYGKMQSKRALAAVLGAVIDTYKYSSLPELNAVLGLYNVKADRGSENSKVFKGGGLMYRILDYEGQPVGVPIKASDFYSKPTLKALENKFMANVAARQPHKMRVKSAFSRATYGPSPSLEGLQKALEKEGIALVLRRNQDGMLYGITYVDHQTKCVFNGSALGKEYSAKAMAQQFSDIAPQKTQAPNLAARHQKISDAPATALTPSAKTELLPPQQHTSLDSKTGIADVVNTIMGTENTFDYIPGQFKRRKKKKRRGK